MSEFSVNPTPPPRTTGGDWRWEPPAPEELQRMLPQFQIESLIGRGGMGAVYRGIQMSLDRVVAIKLLPPAIEKQDEEFAERFRNEARLMGRLNHPAVVSVYDFGRTTEGQLYFVMEFVDGTDVQQMIAREGRLPPEHALAVTAHLCDALGYAHSHGIVHRDIKPSNVLINFEGRVKVADFGLAKLTTADPANSGLTQTGMAMGTPDYVAPEVLMWGSDVDGRADLYAVGVMLYQMLTGDIPRGMFKMPSHKFQSIDPRFDAIVRRALEQDREERYQTSYELRCDLDVILTTPLAVAGQTSSAALPKQAPQDHPASGRTVVPAPREHSSSDPLRHGPFFEPGLETQAPRESSSLPYVIVVLMLLAAGGWYIANNGAGHSEPAAMGETQPTGTAEPGSTTTPNTTPAAVDGMTAERLAALESQFQSAFDRDVNAAHAEQMATLGTNYLAAMERAVNDATKAARLDEALALRDEKQRFTTDKTMPAIDPANLDPAIVRLRTTYRSAEKAHAQARDTASLPTYDSYLKVLTDYEQELMAQGKSAEASQIRVKRDDVAALRKQRAANVP